MVADRVPQAHPLKREAFSHTPGTETLLAGVATLAPCLLVEYVA